MAAGELRELQNYPTDGPQSSSGHLAKAQMSSVVKAKEFRWFSGEPLFLEKHYLKYLSAHNILYSKW
jgi:hypothetical protein